NRFLTLHSNLHKILHVSTHHTNLAQSRPCHAGAQLAGQRPTGRAGAGNSTPPDGGGAGGKKSAAPCVGKGVQSGTYRKTANYAGSSQRSVCGKVTTACAPYHPAAEQQWLEP